jgi:mRNA-degrading endonuclease RelE of RelBE toxin-antitoxin system
LVETRKKKELIGLEPQWEAVPPIWQLRVGEFRVFYDVSVEQRVVAIRAIRRKGSKTTEEIL